MATYTPEQFQKKLQKFAKTQPKAVLKGMMTAANIVRNQAVKKHLSGPKMPVGKGSSTRGTLQPRSGNLRNRMSIGATVSGKKLKATISNNMEYAAIHEYGGTINHPGGTPYFISGGELVFVRKNSPRAAFLPKTQPHTIKIPERSFARSSLKEKRKEIPEIILNAIMRHWRTTK